MNIGYKIVSVAATGALCLSVFATAAFADTSVTISGNGAGSNNHVTVNQSTNCSLTQTNLSQISTEVYSSANTGGNHANGNTGGDVSVSTGDATSGATVSVTGSSNTANNPCCGCSLSSTDLSILNNGTDSHNHITINMGGSQTLSQANQSLIETGVTSKAKTGKNKANNNTNGSTSISTGNGSSTVNVSVGGSSNSL